MGKKKKQKEIILKKAVHISGAFCAAYSFETGDAMKNWLKTTLPKLEERYGDLTLRVRDLDGLRVGDSCWVIGEGAEDFKIKKLIKYSDNRWGFVLDSGCSEEVVKCYKIPIDCM